ncbi:MAG TPA: hypothetical protein PLS70_13255, partial [Acidobacteriota bacterium]|nr:hypothetical protein [Acidobacteriota bacterium]
LHQGYYLVPASPVESPEFPIHRIHPGKMYRRKNIFEHDDMVCVDFLLKVMKAVPTSFTTFKRRQRFSEKETSPEIII